MLKTLSRLFARKPKARRLSFRPALEALEERITPTLSFDWYFVPPGGASSGNWSNWECWHKNSDTGPLGLPGVTPGAADRVTLDLSGKTMNVDVADPTVASLTLTGSGSVMDIGAHTLTVKYVETGLDGYFLLGANFGSIEMSSASSVLSLEGLHGGASWTGSSDINGNQGNLYILANSGFTTDLQITGADSSKNCFTNVHIGSNSRQMPGQITVATSGTSTFNLGTAGTIMTDYYWTGSAEVHGVLKFHNTGTLEITKGAGNTNTLLNKGQMYQDLDTSTVTIDQPVENKNYMRAAGTMNFNGSASGISFWQNLSVDSSHVNVVFNANVGADVQTAAGLDISIGQFTILDAGLLTTHILTTGCASGSWIFGGLATVNVADGTSANGTYHTWNHAGDMAFNGTGTGNQVDVYMRIDWMAGVNKSDTLVITGDLTISGTVILHEKVVNNTGQNVGWWAIDCTGTGNSYNGTFTSIFNGWTGTTALSDAYNVTENDAHGGNHGLKLSKK